jgi:hypothetical protein
VCRRDLPQQTSQTHLPDIRLSHNGLQIAVVIALCAARFSGRTLSGTANGITDTIGRITTIVSSSGLTRTMPYPRRVRTAEAIQVKEKLKFMKRTEEFFRAFHVPIEN